MPHLRFTPAAGLALALVAGRPVTAQDPAVLPSERSRVEHRDWFDDSAADRCTFHGIHHGVGVFGQSGAAAGRPTVRAHRRRGRDREPRVRATGRRGHGGPLAASARRAALVVAGLVGVVLGVGAFTFVYARGYSYLGTDPAACANCHVMWEHFDAWAKSSHRQVAACNDCHAPHDLVGKYATKGINGFLHSLAFTTGRFPNPIRIRGFNHDIIERACRDCHEPIVAAIDPAGDAHQTKDDCTRCHKYVGHWVR